MKRLFQLAALAIVLALAGQTAMAIPNPNPTYCGDPCSPNGAESGCRCPNGMGGYYKTICRCVNGHWIG